MELTTTQALSYLATVGLAVGLYHGIGSAIDFAIELQAPSPQHAKTEESQ